MDVEQRLNKAGEKINKILDNNIDYSSIYELYPELHKVKKDNIHVSWDYGRIYRNYCYVSVGVEIWNNFDQQWERLFDYEDKFSAYSNPILIETGFFIKDKGKYLIEEILKNEIIPRLEKQ